MTRIESPQLLQNIARGIKKERVYLARPAIGEFDTLCLCIFASIFSHATPDPEAIAETIAAYDLLERRNCYFDERKEPNLETDGTTYPFESARLVTSISGRYKIKYIPLIERGKSSAVQEAFENFSEGNKALETFVQKGEIVNLKFQQDIEKIANSSMNDRGRVHKEEINKFWIMALLTILFEDNFEAIDKAKIPLTNLVMLYQLMEDFANFKKDQRIGKKSMFTSQNDQKLLKRIEYLFETFSLYLNNLQVNALAKIVIGLGWSTRLTTDTIGGVLSGDKWRDQKKYSEADLFEKKRYSKL